MKKQNKRYSNSYLITASVTAALYTYSAIFWMSFNFFFFLSVMIDILLILFSLTFFLIASETSNPESLRKISALTGITSVAATSVSMLFPLFAVALWGIIISMFVGTMGHKLAENIGIENNSQGLLKPTI